MGIQKLRIKYIDWVSAVRGGLIIFVLSDHVNKIKTKIYKHKYTSSILPTLLM